MLRTPGQNFTKAKFIIMNTQRSENCGEKAIAYNYTNLMNLYDVFPAKEIPLLLARTRQYLLDGHKWYKKNVKNLDFDDIEENIQFIDDLKLVTEQMLMINGNYISFGSKDRGFEVNLVPFNKYLKSSTIVFHLDMISFMQIKLRLFLNEHNITAFKECAEFFELLSYIISDIECDDAFKYL